MSNSNELHKINTLKTKISEINIKIDNLSKTVSKLKQDGLEFIKQKNNDMQHYLKWREEYTRLKFELCEHYYSYSFFLEQLGEIKVKKVLDKTNLDSKSAEYRNNFNYLMAVEHNLRHKFHADYENARDEHEFALEQLKIWNSSEQ